MVVIGGRGRAPAGVDIYFHAPRLSITAEAKPYATVVSMFGAPDDSGLLHGRGATGGRGTGAGECGLSTKTVKNTRTP